MCLAIPARVTSLDPARETAQVAFGAVGKEISTALVEDLAIGDYVLVHVGYALNKLSPEEAAETLALIAAAGLLDEEPPTDEWADDQGDDRPATGTAR